jgi:hypothetical protein
VPVRRCEMLIGPVRVRPFAEGSIGSCNAGTSPGASVDLPFSRASHQSRISFKRYTALAYHAFWKNKESRFAIATITVLGLGVPSFVLGFGRFRAKSIFRRGSAAATAEKVGLPKSYWTTLKRRRAFANLRLAVFLPTAHLFHKEGVAVVRRGILRQNSSSD